MWPTLLNMTRDECRRTLRRLELEAYANVVGVFRAQGSLEENRKKLLEDLREVLHIGPDRHIAEARRVANDELLATIAEQLTGPNTGLSWMSEGRRLVPLMPRAIPQTAFTEIADTIANQIKSEEKLSNLNVYNDVETAVEQSISQPIADYPIATEDLSNKILEEEMMKRKRKISEVCIKGDEGVTPVKNIRETTVNCNKKHHNIALIYSSFNSKPPVKMTPHSKHAYNQVAKVPKASHVGTPKQRKPRTQKQPKQQRKIVLSKSQIRKLESEAMTPIVSSNQQIQLDYTSSNATYLGSYIQSLSKPGTPTKEEIRINRKSGVVDSNTMRLLSEEDMIEHPDEKIEQPQGTVIGKHIIGGKACQLIIKKKDNVNEILMPKVTTLPPKQDCAKLAQQQHRPIIVTNTAPKFVNTPNRMVTSKNVLAKQPTRLPLVPPVAERVVVTSTSPNMPKIVAKNVVVATSEPSPLKEEPPPKIIQLSPKPEEARKTPDNANAKTFLLNQKVGQKMVVVKGKSTPKSDGQTTPVILKGMPMRFLPVSTQNLKYNNYKFITTSAVSPPNSQTTQKIIKLDSVKSAQSSVIQNATPIKHLNSKGMVVLPKGSPLVKPLQIAKSGEVTKIILKNQSPISPKQDADKIGNIVVVGVNNEQKHINAINASSNQQKITVDTPIIFENQPIDDTCNANSMDSMTDSNAEQTDSSERKDNHTRPVNDVRESESVKDNSSTDWDMDLEGESKEKMTRQVNSVEIAISTDSETDDYLVKTDNNVEKENAERNTDVKGQTSDIFRTSRTLLSQLQDDGSSSTDSSLNLKMKSISRDDKREQAKKEEKEEIVKPLHKPRSDIYSSGLATTEMKLDSFEYLEDEIMSGDQPNIEIQLSHLLTDSHNPSEQRSLAEKVPATK